MYKQLILSVIFTAAVCVSADQVIASDSFGGIEPNQDSYVIASDEEQVEAVIQPAEAEASIGTSAKAGEELPMGIQLYPGAEIQNSRSGMADGKPGTLLVFNTADDADSVIAFYRKELESKDTMFKTETRSGDVRRIDGEWTGGEGVHITVTASSTGGATVTIVGVVDSQ